MNVVKLAKSIVKAIVPLAPISKKRAKALGIIPKGHVGYIVLFQNDDGLKYDTISMSTPPRAKHADLIPRVANMLDINPDHVIGLIRVDEGIRIRLSNDGMEFRMSKSDIRTL